MDALIFRSSSFTTKAMIMIRGTSTGLLLLLAVFAFSPVTLAQAVVSSKDNVLYPLEIETADGIQRYHVEIARTYQEQKRGLMHREFLPASQGMLFLHKQPKVLQMWMKNTLIALDMLFIDQFGTIRHIHTEAQPHDETTISSVHAVVAVLELNAGVVARDGIEIGNSVRLHPIGG